MLIISNAKKVYDGSAGDKTAVRTNLDIAIENGCIKEVRPHDPGLAASLGDGHTLINASNYYVTPGLIDCHSHVTILGLAKRYMDLASDQGQLLYIEKILYTTLVDGGVTSLRDIGGATHYMKRLVDDGVVIGPRMQIAICMLSTTGGHADFRGLDRCHGEISKFWGPAPGRPSSIVDGPWECRKRVREIIACGADLIKICASPGVASPSDKLESRDFTPEEIEAITDEAEGRGINVAAHAHSRQGIEYAIKYGVKDIQHISFMDQRLVEMAYEKGCTVTPTSWIVQSLVNDTELSPFVMEKAKKASESHSQAVEFAAKGGLKILGGTDPVLPGMHGENYKELHALEKEGVSPLIAWYGMTGLAASEIGVENTGMIKSGLKADLLLLKHDVIDQPKLFAADSIVEVFKDGQAYRGGLPGIKPITFASQVRNQLA